MADVGGEEDAGDEACVGGEGADGDKGGQFSVLDQLPDVNMTLRSIVVSNF